MPRPARSSTSRSASSEVFAESVTLAAAGNPAGSTVDFTPNPVTPPGASTMTVTTAGVAAGSLADHRYRHREPERRRSRDDVATLAVFTAGAAAPTLGAPANGAINVARATDFHLECGGGRRRLSARGR